MGHEDLVRLAVGLAETVRAGSPDSVRLAEEFAEAVGEALEPTNRLVAAVLAGGPFTVRRAIELAELVVEAPAHGAVLGKGKQAV